MNKSIYIFALLFAASTLFTSCRNEDDNDNPIDNRPPPTTTTDPGVVVGDINGKPIRDINGEPLRWATRNVNTPGTFVANPEDAGMFFQWNRRIGWSSANPMVNSDGGTTWDDTIPSGTTWETVNNPCPQGWRVPTNLEIQNLHSQMGVWTQRNGVNGRLFGTAPNQIFLPAAGFRHSALGALRDVNELGRYWSSTENANVHAMPLQFSERTSSSQHSVFRWSGYSVRCVAE